MPSVFDQITQKTYEFPDAATPEQMKQAMAKYRNAATPSQGQTGTEQQPPTPAPTEEGPTFLNQAVKTAVIAPVSVGASMLGGGPTPMGIAAGYGAGTLAAGVYDRIHDALFSRGVPQEQIPSLMEDIVGNLPLHPSDMAKMGANFGASSLANLGVNAVVSGLTKSPTLGRIAGDVAGAGAGAVADTLTGQGSFLENLGLNAVATGAGAATEHGLVPSVKKAGRVLSGQERLTEGVKEEMAKAEDIRQTGVRKEGERQADLLTKQEEQAGEMQKGLQRKERGAQLATERERAGVVQTEAQKQTAAQQQLKEKVGEKVDTVGQQHQEMEQNIDRTVAEKVGALEQQYTPEVEKDEARKLLKPHVDEVALQKNAPLDLGPITTPEGKAKLDEHGQPKMAGTAASQAVGLRRSVKEVVHDAAQTQKDYFHGEYERMLKGKEKEQASTFQLNSAPERILQDMQEGGQTVDVSSPVLSFFEKLKGMTRQVDSSPSPEERAAVEQSMNLAPGESTKREYQEGFFAELQAKRKAEGYVPEMKTDVRTLFGLASEAKDLQRKVTRPVDRRAMGKVLDDIYGVLNQHLPPNSELAGKYEAYAKSFGPDVQYGRHFSTSDPTIPTGEVLFKSEKAGGQSSVERVNMLFDNLPNKQSRETINGVAAEYLVDHIDALKKDPDFYANLLGKMYGKGHPLANPEHFLYQNKAVEKISELMKSDTPAGQKLRDEYVKVGEEALETHGKQFVKAVQAQVKKDLDPFFQKQLDSQLRQAKTMREKVDVALGFIGKPDLEQLALEKQKAGFTPPDVAGAEAIAAKQPDLDQASAMRFLEKAKQLGPVGEPIVKQIEAALQTGDVQTAASVARAALARTDLPAEARKALAATLPSPESAGPSALAEAYPQRDIPVRDLGAPQGRTITLPAAQTVEDVGVRALQEGKIKRKDVSHHQSYAEKAVGPLVIIGGIQVMLGHALSGWHAGLLTLGLAGRYMVDPVRQWQLRALRDPQKARAFVQAMQNPAKPNVTNSILRMSFFSSLADYLEQSGEEDGKVSYNVVDPYIPDSPSATRRSSAESHHGDLLAKGYTDVSKSLAKGALTQDDLKGLLQNAA